MIYFFIKLNLLDFIGVMVRHDPREASDLVLSVRGHHVEHFFALVQNVVKCGLALVVVGDGVALPLLGYDWIEEEAVAYLVWVCLKISTHSLSFIHWNSCESPAS